MFRSAVGPVSEYVQTGHCRNRYCWCLLVLRADIGLPGGIYRLRLFRLIAWAVAPTLASWPVKVPGVSGLGPSLAFARWRSFSPGGSPLYLFIRLS